ncbi:hypothetical protein VST7929_02198 [Vibrio stylophorae]|uniref:Capsular biosynthesis protein n=1 Tax=Vibrio stylophorae TaxID=659351 RepID=A0ABM8ZVC6_9VIBR|nr:hypothetical protein [Vibrio stylophorae]CAH0534282.1 hypothetical protein VST7929_02198 [Vibrio stylophorae]
MNDMHSKWNGVCCLNHEKVSSQVTVFSVLCFFVLLFFQLVFGLFFESDFFSMLGGVHLFTICSFLISMPMAVRLDIVSIKIISIFYVLIGVSIQFLFYRVELGSDFGVSPVDADFYHSLALLSSQQMMLGGLNTILEHGDLGDFGFTFITMIVYKVPGDPVVNMKILNALIHFVSGILLLNISVLLNFDRLMQKLLFVIFVFNPAFVFFGASGLKEVLFSFFVIVAILLLYRAVVGGRFFDYLFSLLFIFILGFFRVPFPLFFLGGMSLLVFNNYTGKMRIIIKMLIPVILFVGVFFVFGVLSEEFERILGYNFNAIQSQRLGVESVGVVEYVALILSGIIGPVPSFDYDYQYSDHAFQIIQNYIKIILSIYFVVGCIQIIKCRMVLYYPLLMIYLFNQIILLITAATFDFRYVYPLLSIFCLITVVGMTNGLFCKKISYVVIFVTSILFVIAYNFR